jgi:phage baseplate assembly protein W
VNINDALLTDIEFENDFVKSDANGLQTISGLDNLKQALYARLMTTPGTLVHRPTYGVGIKDYQNSISSTTQQTILANKIQEQFLQDPRVADVTGISIDNTDDEPQLTTINVSVVVVGYTDAQTMSFVPFGGNGGQ